MTIRCLTALILFTSASLCGAADGVGLLGDSNIKGGLVVVVGCDDLSLLASLKANDSYLIHALDIDAGRIAGARDFLGTENLYGKVSVDTFDGTHLPYVDNLVNMIVVTTKDCQISGDEIRRALAPRGVLAVSEESNFKPSGLSLRRTSGWSLFTEPVPEEIDEWTHFLHGADNNAVAKDTVVGPPKRYQWISGPRWARSHDHLSSLSAMVSANGRIFYIIDEAPVASVAFEPEWRLVARDAFSGVLLWKRTVEPWEGHFRQFRTGPTALARRLVASGNHVYVTLGYGKPVSVLDATTGETIQHCEDTANAMEIVVEDGTIYAVVGDRTPPEEEFTGEMAPRGESHWRVMREKAPLKHLVAVDAEAGRLLWKKDDADTLEIMPTAMAVSGGRVFFQNQKAILALDAATGRELWRAARTVSTASPGSSAPTLVIAGGVVICADREVGTGPRERDKQGRTAEWHMYPHTASRNGEAVAYDAATGQRLWSVTSVENFRVPADVFVIDSMAFVRSNQPGLGTGMDLRTGEVKHRPQEKSPIRNPGGHWRCYRNKATENFLILCQRWTEFYDLATGIQTVSSFVRGSCQYGQMPCNGLLYAPHDSCACSIESKLNSFKALAPNSNPTEDIPGVVRLEKGSAYGSILSPSAGDTTADDWPTYRCDSARSGAVHTSIGATLTPAWDTELNGHLTAPVVADGMLITAAPEDHAVHALNADSGESLWRFTAGGSVDSPPTIYHGSVIFGCADGWIYCLRASDGQLAWRYRAAPVDRRIVAYGAVESVWSLHGSVLVQDGTVYAVAGRSNNMDGQFFHALDASTGQSLVETKITQASFPDVLSYDGNSIFMRLLRLNKQGVVQRGAVPHLFSAAGFLDDTWWHRTYWQYGHRMPGGYKRWFSAGEVRPSGRLMVMDEERIHGFGRLNQYSYVGSHVGLGKTQYIFYAANRSDFDYIAERGDRKRLSWSAKKPDIPTLWKCKIGLLARGMVLCKGVLFVAGPPDLLGVAEENDPHPYTPVTERSLRSQREALDGKKGTLLCAFSSADGAKLSEYKLDGLPVWDGLIAARGRLYLTMQDGTVRCLRGVR